VAQLGRVISTDTRFVVIDPDLKASLKAHKPVDFNTLLQGSVQIWATRIEKLGLTPLNHKSRSPEFDVYEWQYDYDPDFLGYMKGVLKLEEFNSAGGAVI
jgi:hypothetical protein